MRQNKQSAVILLESVISLAILTLGIFSLTNTYLTYNKTIKKFSDEENLAYCLRTAAMAYQKQIPIPKHIMLNNINYQIHFHPGFIQAKNLKNENSMEIHWDEK